MYYLEFYCLTSIAIYVFTTWVEIRQMRKFGETEVPVAIQSNISKEEFLKS